MDRPLPDQAQLANLPLIESLYAEFQRDPNAVEPSWRHFFEGVDFAGYLYTERGEAGGVDRSPMRIYRLIQLFRRFGHLLARFNPIETKERGAPELAMEVLRFAPEELEQLFPTLGFCGKGEAKLGEILDALKAIYCGRIGFEYMEVGNREIEQFLQAQIEPQLVIEPTIEERHKILEQLVKAESFENFLNTKFVGQKRFSLEGGEALIPLLSNLIDEAGSGGVDEMVLGMAHRGRLNVLVNLLGKPYKAVFSEFTEGYDVLTGSGFDDVKYHLGFESEGGKVKLHLAPNPSHLEAVDPVVLGQTHAMQRLKKSRATTVPVLVHGDASLAGQGVVYESLQFCRLPGYTTGGTVHIVVNNQIGFTTTPEEGRSTRYCTDIAKAFGAPVFHVSGEDPEACAYVARLAMQLRQKFGCDVFIDLNCYRKYGHNEGDEPSFTQPLEYQMIRERKSPRAVYEEALLAKGLLERKLVETVEQQLKEKLAAEQKEVQVVAPSPAESAPVAPVAAAATAVPEVKLRELAAKFAAVPADFHLHPKLQKWVQERVKGDKLDWSMGEWLAYATLLSEGKAIRLSGQDARRGTFSHRHAMWVDVENAKPYFPLAQFGAFEVYNSPLSEYAVLGFEYGYTQGDPQSLVLWEAQFGDFANGAQVVFDQFIATAERKWKISSSLTLLLPHGYEGQGPEHSSARIERWLELAVDGNIQVVNPTTPAQLFHLLRRKLQKPLIVFTPKSLLRLPACVSGWSEFATGAFTPLIDDPSPSAKRVLFCSGKVYYDLLAARKTADIALVRLEQLHPFPRDLVENTLKRYPQADLCWVQEEPQNMGAWTYIAQLFPKPLRYIGRAPSALTATGSPPRHKQELAALLSEALK